MSGRGGPRAVVRGTLVLAALVMIALAVPATSPAAAAQQGGHSVSQAGPGSARDGEGLNAGRVRKLARQALADPAARRMPPSGGAGPPATGPSLSAPSTTVPSGRPARPATGADAARRAAKDILAGRRFHEHHLPRPLRGVLHTIGGWFEPATRPVGNFFADLSKHVWLALVLALLLAVLAGVLAAWFIRRRSRAGVDRPRRLAGIVADDADPAELERRADRAEAEGRFGEAVRFRFLAGLVRLDRAGSVELRRSETTGQLRTALASADFDALADSFDAVVYGRQRATGADVAAARAGWARLLDRRRRRARVGVS